MSKEIKVNYGYTKNLGNYESERADVSVSIIVDDCTDSQEIMKEQFEKARGFVRQQLQLDPEKVDYDENPPIRRRRT